MRVLGVFILFLVFLWIGYLWVDLAHEPLGLKKEKDDKNE